MNIPGLTRSLSSKLLGLFLLMAFMLIIVGGSNIAISFKNNFEENIRPHLIQYLEYIQTDIGSPPNIEKAKLIASRLPVEVEIISNTLNWSSNNDNIDLSKINYYRMYDKDNLNYKMGEFDSREYLVIHQANQTLVFSIPHPHEKFRIKHLIPIILILILFVIFYYSTRRIFQPIQTIEEGIIKIGQGNLDHRIQVDRDDELGSLANNINSMTDDINNMLDAKRQLLLAISHEIRTPVTRAKIAANLLENEKHKVGIVQDLDEIETLTEEILETERLSSRHQALNKEPVFMEELVRDVVETYYTKDKLTLTLEKTLRSNLDASRIKLLVKNLIGNAIQHNDDSVNRPLIRTLQNGSNIIFSVKDFGSGIEKTHLPHLTEPFYRVDPSRKRSTGGYGLGLYLCRIIAEAHGGKLEIKSELGLGTEVTIKIPVNVIPI